MHPPTPHTNKHVHLPLSVPLHFLCVVTAQILAETNQKMYEREEKKKPETATPVDVFEVCVSLYTYKHEYNAGSWTNINFQPWKRIARITLFFLYIHSFNYVVTACQPTYCKKNVCACMCVNVCVSCYADWSSLTFVDKKQNKHNRQHGYTDDCSNDYC